MPLVSHPRLLVTSTNLAAVKARLGTGGVWETDFQTWIDWADGQYATALDASLANLIFLAADYAFLYMTHGVTGASYGHTQAQYGTLARDILIEISVQSSVVGNYDWYGVPLAYDWCHPLLSGGDKTTLVTLMKTIDDFDLDPPTASAFDSQVTVGRCQALLSALAFADDGVDDAWATAKLAQYPEYYEPGSGVTGSESVLDGEDGGCGQGMQYGFYTYPQTLLAEEGYRTAYDTDATTFYSPAEKSYLRQYAFYILYYILPWAPGGDYIFWKSEQTTARTGAQTGIVQSVLTAGIGVFDSVDSDISELAQWLLDNRTGQMESGDAFYMLQWGFWKFALGNQTTPVSPITSAQPLSKLCADGHAFLRTGWDDVNDTLVTYTVNPWHRDPAGMSPNFPGGITIDRNGPLAIRQGGKSGHDAGAAGHFNCNILQFVDTTQTEAGPYPDDDQGGGRMLPGDLYGSVNFVTDSDYDLRGEVRFLSHDDVDRDVDYIRSDNTRGYSSTLVNPPDNPARISSAERSLVYFRPTVPGTDSDRIVICDKATTLSTNYEKRWLWHSSATPSVNGVETVGIPERPAGIGLGKWTYTGATLATFTNTVNGSDGKMFITPVLPTGRIIVRVGGPNEDGDSWFTVPPSHEFEDAFGGLTAGSTPGTDQEQYIGQYRIEVIPTVDSLYDIFLNVVETGDTSLTNTTVINLACTGLVACRIGDRVAVFNNVIGDVTTGSVTMDAASGTYRFHFADLTPDTEYTVTVGGTPQSETSTSAGTLYLELAVTSGMVISLGPFVTSASRAITLNGASDYLVRTTEIVPASSDYSAIFWCKTPLDAIATYRTFFLQVDDVSVYAEWIGLYTYLVSGNDDVSLDITGSGTVGAYDIIQNKWTPYGYVREGTANRFYANGILVGTITLDVSAFTLDQQYLGSDTFSEGIFQFLGFREWDKALDLAGLIVEWNSPTAVDTVNLWADTPNGVNDISGNGRDWTVVGSPVFDDNPPVQIPLTNTSSGAAYVIPSLPFNAIQVVKDSAGVLQSSWYNYTGTSPDVEASLKVFGNPTTYEPRLRVDIDNTSTNLGEIDANEMDLIPLLDGRLYIFRAYELSPSATSASLELTIKVFTNASIPLGTILIRAASISQPFLDAGYTGLGAGYIDATNGDIINFNTDVIPGESGDYMPNTGEILYGDEYVNPGNLVLFDNALNIIATIPYASVSFPIIRTNREGRKFYVGNRGSSGLAIPSEYVTVDEDGNISTPVVLGSFGMTAIAASPDESIVYVAGRGGSVSSPIKQWDVSGFAFIADLVAGVTGYIIQDILVMSNGDLVVLYSEFNSPFAAFVRIYDSAGATIDTYTPTTTALNSFAPRLGYANDDSISFWILLHQDDGFSAFRNVRVSDLVELEAFLTPSSDYLEIDHGPDPEFDFVVSNTCPIVLIVGEAPPPGNGSITVIKVVSPVNPVPEFDFTTTGGLSPSTFSLNHGDEQVFSELDPGTYGVSETPEAGYTTTYEVSNGDPHDAIELDVDEDVTVTVTNTLNVTPPASGSGIYKIVPQKREDTLWVSFDPPETLDVKIPNPFFDTALLGD